ncbi:transporter substrate-binding domain-containing protein [Desulfomonile tiedjei]|uniref:histidine kinase n=1 Tax=Desulfomonile tiedjei (strain ATCC 49306 / DSM 6799 / DCB-1) TaxID=706587 RepID=I4C2H7_DESTA|nr:transporter substrate-binding domain-containing protein [Desulfomonile tiedjei]AFM23768.1 bacteriophytochrome (light-regulated signal transduction histidine kinase) [Desulfomonile tiedjei DSM 6799]
MKTRTLLTLLFVVRSAFVLTRICQHLGAKRRTAVDRSIMANVEGCFEAVRSEASELRCFLSLFLIVSFFVFGFFFPGNCSAETDRPVIRVGSEIEFPPFALVDESGQPSGFSVDLIKAVAEAMGLSVVFESGDWNKMWNDLVSGKLDVLPIVAKSTERARLVDFSLAHTETFDAFFVRDGSPILGTIEAAQGKTIVAMRSDAAHHELLELNFQGELMLADTIPEGLSMVAAGKCDAFLCSKLIGILAIKTHGIRGLTAGPPIPDYKRVFSFGIRKGEDELKEKLNQGLLIVKTGGQYDRIYEKWLAFDDPWLRYRKYLLLGLPVAIVIAFGAMLWSAMLKKLVSKRTSELAAKNEELEHTLTDLIRANADLEHFAYVASHDLQEPLRTVASALQMFEKKHKGKFDKDSDQLIDFAVNGAKRMRSLIRDLLTYSRLDTQGQSFTAVDMTEVLDRSIENCGSLIKEKGTEITYDRMPTITGDPLQLVQLLQNLIGNAVKFGPAVSSKVHVSAQQNGNEWVFSVKDNGTGIKEKYFDRIFVIFQQLSKKGPFHGTGIGLAIVKKIVERHHGRVWVESEVGVGSTFYFAIPNRICEKKAILG